MRSNTREKQWSRVGRLESDLNPPLGVRTCMGQTCFRAVCVLSLVVAGFQASAASAMVTARVCLADEVTPLAPADPNVPEVYRDIMVGTRLTIFITSDTAKPCRVKFWLSWETERQGALSPRGYDESIGNYVGSCLPAAGERALVTMYRDDLGVGVDLLPAWNATAGDLFILDYGAVNTGVCTIGLYALSAVPIPVVISQEPPDPPPFEATLIQVLSFHHVPSRDFDGDTLVNFVDYASLAGLWGQSVVSDPNAAVAADLNGDERVDVRDLALFGEYWLERTQAVGLSPEPNEIDSVP
ncbi:MAG: hypothetical protein GXY19_04905 [Phycisphaerae bacterium]|nr:hypothetical protein [Phycisphaerae bacterium]